MGVNTLAQWFRDSLTPYAIQYLVDCEILAVWVFLMQERSADPDLVSNLHVYCHCILHGGPQLDFILQ